MENKKYLDFEREALPHIDALYNFALALMGYTKKAAKLLKITYLNAFYFYDKIERGPDIKMWLFRIMYNSYLKSGTESSYHFETRNNEIETQFAGIKNSYEQIKSSSLKDFESLGKFFKTISSANLIKEINLLPENLRIVMILCEIENFSYEQISDLVDVPVNVIISRISRARISLFSKIHDQMKFTGI